MLPACCVLVEGLSRMFRLSVGVTGEGLWRSFLLAAVGLVCFVAGGCSSSKPVTSPAVYSWNMNGVAPAAYRPRVPRRELEDDGIEVQAPPDKHVRMLPDDPREPWSRNYGRSQTSTAVSSWSGESSADDAYTVTAE